MDHDENCYCDDCNWRGYDSQEVCGTCGGIIGEGCPHSSGIETDYKPENPCRACLMNDGYKTKECNNCEVRITRAKGPIVTCEMVNS